MWIGLLGLVLPLGAGLKVALDQRSQKKPAFPLDKNLFTPPRWLWAFFILLLLFTRFYRLTTLPPWLLADEGNFLTIGMDLARHWNWKLLWGFTQNEPLFFWVLGFYFKFLNPSLFSIRFFPAIISLATILAAYWAARSFFSKFTSFFFCALIAFSFWELTLSRLCMCVVLIPLFQFLCFGCLGRLLKPDERTKKWMWLGGLSLFAGFGFYIWTTWVSVWFCLAFILFIYYFFKDRKNRVFFWIFFSVTVLMDTPLLIERLSPGGMTHISQVVSFSNLGSFFQCLTELLWNGSFDIVFDSKWGGSFNPVMDSLIFIGLLYLAQSASRLFIVCVSICLIFSILPAAATNVGEWHRMMALPPFLTIFAALGITSLMPPKGKPMRLAMAVLVLLCSFGLDAFNYACFYCDIKSGPPLQQWRTQVYSHAYQIIKSQSEKTGPLYVFSEFNLDYDDKTLNAVDYPFEAIQNPTLSVLKPRYSVLLTDIDFAPYLIKNFPGMTYELLSSQGPYPGVRPFLALFLIPTDSMPAETLKEWLEADQVYRKVNINIKNMHPLESWGDFLKQFSFLENQFKGDRFLRSIYWEKTAFFNLVMNNYPDAERAYENAIHLGYPAPHLYYRLGLTLKAIGKASEGQKFIQKAEKLSDDAL
ncbi:MAG TPA: glycosyltransferase family 39 protein [bacterium]